jgi:hypothetical protein
MQQQIEVAWTMSEEARKRILIETGQELSANRSFTIELTDLTPEQRAPIIERLFPHHSRIDASAIYEFDPDVYFRDYLNKATFKYDEQPSVDQVAAIAERQVEEIKKADTYKAEVKAQEKAERQRRVEIYERFKPILEDLIDAEDYDALNTFFRDHPEAAKVNSFRPNRGVDSLSNIVTCAMREIRKKRWQEDMNGWAMEHGSQHLRDCILRDYHCERLYVKERAAKDFPGWTVDFYNESAYNERTNPTHQALRVEKSLAENDLDVEIVWLTAPAQDSPREPVDAYYDEPFEPCEAIVIHNYLDKYDLVREIVEF